MLSTRAVLADLQGHRDMDGARYLEDGRLTIFKRSGVFYARIRSSMAPKYIWRSLKTTDEQIANRPYCLVSRSRGLI